MIKTKRFLSLFLVLCMCIGMLPMSAFATSKETVCDVESQSTDSFSRILHLDCGRKYFTKDWIIALINEMAAAGYNQLQLAFGNEGMRFLLDDMSVTVNGTTYSDDAVTAGIQAGNTAYNAKTSATKYYSPSVNELTQTEMDEIIAHAQARGIEIVPHMNMPGHMNAILDAIEDVGISNAHFTGYETSSSSLNLNNDAAVAFAKALLTKYVNYFKENGCNYFHIGADEFANDAYYGAMGFPNMGSALYTKFAAYVNDCAKIVESADMTPRAWNDGLYFTYYSDTFDTDIQITYWSSGWGSYPVASASTQADKDHDMINTHGDYYFVLTKSGITNPSSTALNFKNDTFAGGSIIEDSVGSMFCIWCDFPGTATEQEVAEAARITLRKMAAAMKNSTSYSEDVVSGGFKADGTINYADLVTKTDSATNVSVTACGLTGLTVTPVTANVPTVEGASEVTAWEMTPATADGNYSGNATVSVPVPLTWTEVRGGVLASGSDPEVMDITGNLKDGVFTFIVPHFSTVLAYNLSRAGEGDEGDAPVTGSETIELMVDESKTEVIEGGNYRENITIEDDTIVKVTATYTYQEGSGGSVETVTSLEDGKEYYIINSAGQYLADDLSWADSSAQAVAWTAKFEMNMGVNFYSFSYNGQYIEDPDENGNWVLTSNGYTNLWFRFSGGNLTTTSGGSYAAATGAGGSEAINQTDVTFRGLKAGTTTVTVGNTTYTINVHGKVNITINYVLADGTVINSETVSVVDNETTYDLSNFDHTDGKYYTVSTPTLTIDPLNKTTYTVTVTEREVNPETVAPINLELWITNAEASPEENGSSNEIEVKASDAGIYSADGVDVTRYAPQSAYKIDGNKLLSYWHSRLLGAGNHQTGANGVNKTTEGVAFTKIRYWDGKWQVLSGSTWRDVASDDQLVAYYMQVTEITDEITTKVVDWGPTYADMQAGIDDWVFTKQKYNYLDYAVVYPAGTQSPESFPASTTLFFDDAPRSIGATSFDENNNYEIWQITVTEGRSNDAYYLSDFKPQYDDSTEKVLWDEKKGGDPIVPELNFTGQNTGKLVRIYVKPVEAPVEEFDTLTVVYYDEKFNDTLYTYNILVEKGSNFTENLDAQPSGDKDTAITHPSISTEFPNRYDVSSAGILNNLEKMQYFETNLVNVPEAKGKYNSGLYSYTGSVITDDKTLTHYYTIKTETLSPNFVADFGLPLEFPLSMVVGEGEVGKVVAEVTVNPVTKFGTLSYDSTNRMFTYVPTSILTTIDVLTLNIRWDGETKADIVNVGVTPATTVYYEESFINWESGWSGAVLTSATQKQEPEVLADLGEESQKVNNYGYDPYYAEHTAESNGSAATATAIGSRGSFTFVGDGVQVFASAAPVPAGTTAYVAVEVRNADTNVLVSYAMVNTANTTNLYGLPVVTLVDLSKMTHGTYTVNITKVMDTNPVSIDGIRIFNTITDADTFKPDLEDNPEFYELRDVVLTAIGIKPDTSTSYETLYEQVYTEIAGKNGTAFIFNKDTAYSQSGTLQELLDNGPKNELFLNKDDTLTFKVQTKRVIQIGLKAPSGTPATAAVTVKNVTDASNPITVKSGDISVASTVDMFYTLVGTPAASDTVQTYEVSIENTGAGILSVTDLKICDDPNASFVPFTAEDVVRLLGGEPEVNPEPEKIFADAVLKINVKNLEGTVLGSVELTANGLKDGTHIFTAAEILAAAKSVLPEKHYIADESAVTDVEVIYGGSKPVSVLANEEELADNGFDYEMWQWMMLLIMSQKKTIVAEAGEGGFITNAGATQVRYQTSQTYYIFPNEGYEIEAVLVDGVNVGAVSEYTFNRVQNDHTISAFFSKIETPAAAEKEEPKLPPQSDEKDGKLFSDVSAKAWYHDDVAFVYANELMIGTSDTEFSPEMIVNRAMLVTVLWRLEGSPVVDDMAEFKDIPMGEWYTDAVNWAFVNGIVNGYGDDSFGPLNELTREQIMAILNRYAAYKKWTDASVDLMTSSYKHSGWAENNVLWADTNGMFKGIEADISDLTQAATRAEMAAYLNRFCKNFMD